MTIIKAENNETDSSNEIEELKSKPWLESEISDLEATLIENDKIISNHETMLLVMEAKDKLNEEDKKTIIRLKKIIQDHQMQNQIVKMVLNYYKECLQALK